MSGPLMTLGPVAFAPNDQSLPLNSHGQDEEWFHRFHPAIEGQGRRGFHGRRDQLRVLRGIFFPRQFGAEAGPNEVRELANLGQSWQLIDGSGNMLGRFVILSIRQTHEVLLADGTGRRVLYEIQLREDPNAQNVAGRAREQVPTSTVTPATDAVI